MSSSNLPASCIDLDLKRVYRELVRTGGSIIAAAHRLNVPPEDLRRMTTQVPVLLEAALEAEEQNLDKAEGVMREALDSDDKMRRFKAAAFVLRRSAAAKRRGWGKPAEPAADPELAAVTIKWLDPKAS
jgi:hypothetical protein